MTATYDPVEWVPGPVTLANLQQMANNDQWMFENMPRMKYAGPQINRNNGLKIAAGRVLVPGTSADWASQNVYFGNFFSAGCNPVVVASFQSTAHGRRKFVDVSGISGTTAIDNRGFNAYISSHETRTSAGGWNTVSGGILNWIAVGY